MCRKQLDEATCEILISMNWSCEIAYGSPSSLLLQPTAGAAEVQAWSDHWTFDIALLLYCMLKNRCPKTALYADMLNDKVMYASRYPNGHLAVLPDPSRPGAKPE